MSIFVWGELQRQLGEGQSLLTNRGRAEHTNNIQETNLTYLTHELLHDISALNESKRVLEIGIMAAANSAEFIQLAEITDERRQQLHVQAMRCAKQNDHYTDARKVRTVQSTAVAS